MRDISTRDAVNQTLVKSDIDVEFNKGIPSKFYNDII